MIAWFRTTNSLVSVLMRYIILVISTVLALQLHPRHRIKEIWDEHPNLEGIFELDTLISGYWEVRIDDKRTLYPTMVGYLAQPDMKNYTGQPAMSSVMERSYYYFRFRIPDDIDGQYDVFYEDKYVRVFVGIK